MSVTISNCNQICNSPTNTSASKMLFSFSKTSRFPFKKSQLCDRFYEIPSSIESCRTTSLGFGNKYDFTHHASKNPSPNRYHLNSDFSPNKTQGFGFGKGRDEMEITGPLANVKINKNPGPGTYPIPSALSKSTYSLGGKIVEEDKEKMKIPGPGTYPITFGISRQGDYFLSKYKSSKVRDFSKVGGRVSDRENKVPGPGSYETTQVDLSPQGRYVTSKLRNCLARKFAITTRRPIADKNENPGPGNYKLPSDFGHYVAKAAVDQSKTSPAPSVDASKTCKTQTTQ